MNILHIDSSILGVNSVTRELGAAVVADLRMRHPQTQLRYRDLAQEPFAHLAEPILAAQSIPVEQRNAEQQREIAANAQALDEFLAADVVVIGAPMYNFSIPSQLKAWIDRIAVRGKTFRYGANGAEGLAGGKQVIIVSARGGFYGEQSPAAGMDFQESYLKVLFGFLGITDIEFLRAEGLNVSAEQRSKSMQAAHRQIRRELAEAA